MASSTSGGPKTTSTRTGFWMSIETGACHQKLSKNMTLNEKARAAINM